MRTKRSSSPSKIAFAACLDSEMNALTVFWGTGKKQMQKASKTRLARILITLIADRYNEKNINKTH